VRSSVETLACGLTRWGAAFILALSGVTKVWSPFQAGLMLEGFIPGLRGIAAWLPDALVCLLGALEVGVGISCIQGTVPRLVGYLLVLMGTLIALFHVMLQDLARQCGCFGGLFELTPAVGVAAGATLALCGILSIRSRRRRQSAASSNVAII
jgi:hypothetical protein